MKTFKAFINESFKTLKYVAIPMSHFDYVSMVSHKRDKDVPLPAFIDHRGVVHVIHDVWLGHQGAFEKLGIGHDGDGHHAETDLISVRAYGGELATAENNISASPKAKETLRLMHQEARRQGVGVVPYDDYN